MAAMQPSTASKGVKIEGRTGATPHLRFPKGRHHLWCQGLNFQAKEGLKSWKRATKNLGEKWYYHKKTPEISRSMFPTNDQLLKDIYCKYHFS